jgi:ATP-dependent DNA helicase RecG
VVGGWWLVVSGESIYHQPATNNIPPTNTMNILELLKSGESETVEFKRTFGKEVIIALTAFANTGGGRVVVGVNQQGRRQDIPFGPETEQRYLNEIENATYPQIIPHVTSFDVSGKNVLVFEVAEYPVKPIAYKNRYYKRVKNSNHILSLDEIVDLQQQSLNISYDAYPLKESLQSFDRTLMQKFCYILGRVSFKPCYF